MNTVLRLGLCLATFAACRGTLPPSEPPRSAPEGAPAMHTNDAPTAGPMADEQVAAPPDTLPGPNNPAGIAEPSDKPSTATGGTTGSSNR